MYKEFLPVGSVVKLKGLEKRLVVFGIMPTTAEENKVHDYFACLYPEGILGEDSVFLFNSDEIEKVEFVGYTDSERQKFIDSLQKYVVAEEANNGEKGG